MGEPMMLAVMVVAAMVMMRCFPNVPVSRWLAAMTVDPLARRLNRTTPAQWVVLIGGVALIGLAIWFEIDEIRMLAGLGGSVGEITTLLSTIEWSGMVELGLAGLMSRTVVARLPVFRHVFRMHAQRNTTRSVRSRTPANDEGDGGPVRLIA